MRIYLELPNTGFLNSKPGQINFGGLCGKKNTRVVFAVRDTSEVLEWKNTLTQRSKSVWKHVLECKLPFRTSFSLDFGEIDQFWLWCGNLHDQEDPGVYIHIHDIM